MPSKPVFPKCQGLPTAMATRIGRVLEPLDAGQTGHASWNGVGRLHRRASRNSSITLAPSASDVQLVH